MCFLSLDSNCVCSQASYGVEDPEYAVTQLAQTTMRSELGKLTLDKVFRVICLALFRRPLMNHVV